jgi:progressive ankylosis protein
MATGAGEQDATARESDHRAGPPRDRAAAIAHSYKSIFLFWVPLSAQWVMMATEGPFLAAIIARMDEPTFNLAAFGVAFAFAILVESPVIMLMSASTALVEDAESYRRLRNFANALNIGSTLLLVLVLLPPVYHALAYSLLDLPEPIGALVYGALWFLLPWPAAIGYRRFLHGVLIRSGRTRQVAYGTLIRLAGMAAMAVALFVYGGLPGAWVGAAGPCAGGGGGGRAARGRGGGGGGGVAAIVGYELRTAAGGQGRSAGRRRLHSVS